MLSNGYLITFTELNSLGFVTTTGSPSNSSVIVTKEEALASYYLINQTTPFAAGLGSYAPFQCPPYEAFKGLITATISSSPTSCYGGSNGSITISSINYGYGPTYQTKLEVGGTYVNFSGSVTYSSLSAGTHTIYIKDKLHENKCIHVDAITHLK